MRNLFFIYICISMPSMANEPDTHNLSWFWSVIVLLLILQTLLIIGLQRSRLNNKRAKEALRNAQKELEEKVLDRTKSLEGSNLQLKQAANRHLATKSLLEKTQHYWHSIINSMPSVIIGVTHDGFITHWNLAAEKKTGLLSNQAHGEHIQETYPSLPLDYQMVITRAIESKTPYISQNLQEGLKDNLRYSDVTIYPLLSEKISGAVIRIDDVTLRVRVENMMIQNEKMLSLGELAAGIAHEINNPLSIILHGSQNIQRRLWGNLPTNHSAAENAGVTLEQINAYLEDRNIQQFINDIKSAGERSASIVSNMLDFSHSPDSVHQYFDLSHTISHSLELLATEREITPKIQINIPEDLSRIFGNAVEIQQVILNLVRNAAQALKTNEDGLSCIYINASESPEFIIIEVSDNGPGIQDEIARHIFEPFFTTKKIGKGTGLGLSVSYFIITDHHSGTIEVQSTPGEGTCFHIELPKH